MATAGAPWLSRGGGDGADATTARPADEGRSGWWPPEAMLAALGERWLLPGRHRRTASMEARQGWIWSGMLKVTSATMAALAIVEATEAGSSA